MSKSLNLAWTEKDVIEKLKHNASDSLPFETGGCLMGYWVKEFTEVVITEIIGPGPNSKHGKWFFLPDTSWQAGQIARIYTESGRLITYLGDWHTHPTNISSLSIIDKWTMMRINQHKPARTRAPLMIIVHNPLNWTLTVHCRRDMRKRKLFINGEYVRFDIKSYTERGD